MEQSVDESFSQFDLLLQADGLIVDVIHVGCWTSSMQAAHSKLVNKDSDYLYFGIVACHVHDGPYLGRHVVSGAAFTAMRLTMFLTFFRSDIGARHYLLVF